MHRQPASHEPGHAEPVRFELKSISAQSIPEALERVERYRLLNEPSLAESICLDILAVEPAHQQALISLLLARTDQFSSSASANINTKAAQDVLPQITGDYERAYYTGIFWERLGHSRLRQHGHGEAAYHALREAMQHYEKASGFNPANDDPTLRWNTCARVIMQNPQICPREEAGESWVSDEAGSRIADA